VKKVLAAAFVVVLSSTLAEAADMPVAPPVPLVLWSWTGLYLGGHVGAVSASATLTDPAGPAIYGNTIRSPGELGGVQVGYNWQVPNTGFVLGAEADASALGAFGTNTCLASSGFFFSANCRVRPDAFGTFTGRIGFAAGPYGRTLIYAKGGFAWLDDRIDMTSNDLSPTQLTSFDGVRWGWTAGAGIERALTPAFSLRLEYDYAKFGDLNMATPASLFQVVPPFAASLIQTNSATASTSQNLQTVKVGLNYKFGEDINAHWEPAASDYRLRGATDPGYIPDADIEVGGRVWYSSGRFQKDLGGTIDTPSLLVSRLTYDTTGVTGEVFGRVDSSWNVFIKGFVGGGAITSGTMHDEDWGIPLSASQVVPYSNTLSTVKGDIGYGTFDAGYSLFRGPSANVGGFIGFNYYRENKRAYGCNQIANAFSDCVPALPNSILGITEDDKWYSFRVGVNGVVTIFDRLKLTADAAYLPFVAFRGTDNHLLCTDVTNTVSPETGEGQGVQLEALLSYAFANNFNVGAGGRYWAMWAPGAYTNIFGTPCPCQTLPVKTERYGGFLQASYKLDGLK
jgi:opacity protein-like surface antigen